MLTLDELRADVESGAVDTVIAAFTDMQGRLMGKRMHAEFFLEELGGGHDVGGWHSGGAAGGAMTSRGATTCSRSTWRWIRSRATHWRAGSAATGTSGCTR